jgi:hypothetical protein
MTKPIIGVNIEIEYSGGEIRKGHLSPRGVHIHKDQDNATLRETLTTMRESITGLFKVQR